MGVSKKLSEFILLTGSNLGNSVEILSKTLQELSELGTIKKKSSIYLSEPWGLKDQPDFFNQAIILQSYFNPEQILNELLILEKKFGRLNKGNWQPRVIDIDILFCDEKIINIPKLKIPHPHLHERRFALLPVAEIAPDKVHPVFNKSVSELLIECDDKLKVEKFL